MAIGVESLQLSNETILGPAPVHGGNVECAGSHWQILILAEAVETVLQAGDLVTHQVERLAQGLLERRITILRAQLESAVIVEGGRSDVVQVGSDDDAEKARDWLHEEALKPCPHSCAVEFAEFDVEGIPGAKGAHRSASEADIEALGNSEDKPFDGYTIDFADGPTPTASRSRGHRGA
jgi:hypothetical protein